MFHSLNLVIVLTQTQNNAERVGNWEFGLMVFKIIIEVVDQTYKLQEYVVSAMDVDAKEKEKGEE